MKLFCLCLAAASLSALGADLVDCGPFVKVYDPGVGEKDPWYINDHCFIHSQDGMWHLFGITRQEPAKGRRRASTSSRRGRGGRGRGLGGPDGTPGHMILRSTTLSWC